MARVHSIGLRGINTNADPQNQGFPDLGDRHWDPLWEACADLAMPVNFHIGASNTSMSWLGSMPWPSFDDERKLALGSLGVMISNFRTIGNLLLSGVLERHPTLHVVSVESGLGWIPFLLEGLDYEIGECAPHIADHLSLLPSEYFRRQVHVCYWFERDNLQGAIDALGHRQHPLRDRLPAPDVPLPGQPGAGRGAAPRHRSRRAAQDPQHQCRDPVPDPAARRHRSLGLRRSVTEAVLRAHTDVTPAFLTQVLRDQGWIGDATVVAAPAETVGAGLMGICARYHLQLDRDVPGAPASVVGKFAAQDATAREFMASSGYPNELCFYRHFASRVTIRAPRCAYAAIDDDGWFTLILEDCAPMEPGDQLRGCTVGQVEAAVLELVGLHAPFWDAPELQTHECFADRGTVEPELLVGGLQAVVPGFIERYGAAFAPDEVAFYERFGKEAGNWFAARTTPRSLVHSDFRPDNLLFSVDEVEPTVAVVDWQGFSRGWGMSDVSFVMGNALTPDVRRAHEERLVRAYHGALVATGVASYPFEECWDEYAGSLLSALLTTIFGAMYGMRTERGDRMFELMGARHARQILDVGADRYLDG